MQTTLDDELAVLLFRFIYMGVDIAMERQSWSHIGFIFFSIVSFCWIEPPNFYYALYIMKYDIMKYVSIFSVASLICCLSLTCRSSYYLQGIIWLIEIPSPTPLFSVFWMFINLIDCFWKMLSSFHFLSFFFSFSYRFDFEGLQMSSLVHTY